MSVSVMSTVSVDPNQGGASALFTVPESGRYTPVPSEVLADQSVLSNLSSAKVFSSARADATLILFSSFFFNDNYNGRFLQITNSRNAASEIRVDNFPPGFDNSATSLLLVAANQSAETRLSYRDLFLDEWITTLDDQVLRDSRAQRTGETMLTWRMFPDPTSELSPDRGYLKVIQPLHINVPAWPDYEATIAYHIYLYLEKADPMATTGRLRGTVANKLIWVEDGVKHDHIYSELNAKVDEGIGTLNMKLAERLDAFQFIKFTDLYYLPGRQPNPAPAGVLTGTTYDDVTIVLQS
jgi:hypothetical protein